MLMITTILRTSAIALAFTAAVTLASFLIPWTLAGLLGATQENMPDVSNYIIGRGIGVIPLLLGQQLASFLQLERQSMRNYVATGLMLVVNAGFDLFFTAVLNMGAMGLGIATSLSNWAYLAVVGSFFLKKEATLKYSIRTIDWKEMASMVGIGFPSALLVFLTALRGTIFNRMLAEHATLEAVTALFAAAYALIYWKRLPKTLEEWITLPPDFGASEEQRLDITIHSMDEVTATSKRVLAFCSGRGIERRRAYYSALCLEEIAANIVKHGFHADNKSHAVDVRVVHKGEDVILRVKDDCAPFNPQERAELLDTQDMTRNIGLRMVMRIAKSVDYQNLLGLNVLTMRV